MAGAKGNREAGNRRGDALGIIAYKNNAEDVIQRLTGLVEGRARDQIFAAFVLPSKAMKQFKQQYTESFFSEYPDPRERMDFWDRHLEGRTLLEDDSIPYAYPSEFDQGLYGGMLGGDVRFLAMAEDGWVSSGWISSMVPPLLEDWSELDSLSFDESNRWFQRYRTQLHLMVERAEGKFGISHLILIDSINFVFELVGATNTYLSMQDNPAVVHRAVEFAYHINLRVHDTFFDIVPLLRGGTCSWVLPWIPGKIVCESVDPFHMTSLDWYEEWGRDPIERIFGAYDGGVIHIHANGRHLIERVCDLKGLKGILMVDEKDYRPSFDMLDELERLTGDVPMSVYANYEDFLRKLDQHTLPGNTFYHVMGAEDADSVNRCMEKVRKYRA
jgi:hypothetical protein